MSLPLPPLSVGPRPYPDSSVAIGQSAPGSGVKASRKTKCSSIWTLELREMTFSAELIHELNGLASLSGGRNLFFETEFQIAGRNRVLPHDTRQLVLSESIGGETSIRLYLPIVLTRRGIPPRRYWRVASHPFGPLSLPLVEYCDREEICEQFSALIGRLPVLDRCPLLFEDLPVADPVITTLRECLTRNGHASILRTTHSRAVLLPSAMANGAGDAFVRNALPRKKRRGLGRQRRRLEELGELRLEHAEDFELMRRRFEEFLLLETRGWKGRKGTSLHVIRQTAAFARQCVTALASQKRSAIYSLRLDDRPVASLIMLRSGHRYYPWKIAFDATYGAYSPGIQLILAVTRDLLERRGFAFADSLSGENSWIDSLWPDRIELGVLICATDFRPAHRYRAHDRTIEFGWKVSSAVKRMIGR